MTNPQVSGVTEHKNITSTRVFDMSESIMKHGDTTPRSVEKLSFMQLSDKIVKIMSGIIVHLSLIMATKWRYFSGRYEKILQFYIIVMVGFFWKNKIALFIQP